MVLAGRADKQFQVGSVTYKPTTYTEKRTLSIVVLIASLFAIMFDTSPESNSKSFIYDARSAAVATPSPENMFSTAYCYDSSAEPSGIAGAVQSRTLRPSRALLLTRPDAPRPVLPISVRCGRRLL